MEISNLIPHIEALIFASDRPLPSVEITELVNQAFGFMEDKITLDQIESAIEGILEKYRAEFYPFEVRESGVLEPDGCDDGLPDRIVASVRMGELGGLAATGPADSASGKLDSSRIVSPSGFSISVHTLARNTFFAIPIEQRISSPRSR